MSDSAKTLWQYFCRKCGYERVGLLDHPHGIGGYSWSCPECGSYDIDSKPSPPISNAAQT